VPRAETKLRQSRSSRQPSASARGFSEKRESRGAHGGFRAPRGLREDSHRAARGNSSRERASAPGPPAERFGPGPTSQFPCYKSTCSGPLPAVTRHLDPPPRRPPHQRSDAVWNGRHESILAASVQGVKDARKVTSKGVRPRVLWVPSRPHDLPLSPREPPPPPRGFSPGRVLSARAPTPSNRQEGSA
jgi:hypothetical protein